MFLGWICTGLGVAIYIMAIVVLTLFPNRKSYDPGPSRD